MYGTLGVGLFGLVACGGGDAREVFDAAAVDGAARDSGTRDATTGSDAARVDGASSLGDAGSVDAAAPGHAIHWGDVDVDPLGPCSVVYDVPPAIDATGTVEISTALMTWLAALPPATRAAPACVRFAASGTYWMDYTLLLRKRVGASGGISGRVWPDLPAFDRSFTRFELNGATLEQRTTLDDDRAFYGLPLVFTAGAHDLELTGGTLTSSHTEADGYRPAREDWTGVRITGDANEPVVENIWLHDLAIRHVWGDFVYLVSATATGHELRDVVIEDCAMQDAGRQGIVLHGGTRVAIRRNQLRDVERFLFDSETTPGQGWQYVSITGNSGHSGDLGYLQHNGMNRSTGDHLELVDNTIDVGVFRLCLEADELTPRRGFRFVGNRNIGAMVFRSNTICPAVVRLLSWDEVEITDNLQAVDPAAMINAVRLGGTPPLTATVERNCWPGALDDSCPAP